MVLHSVGRIAVRVLAYSSGEKRNEIHPAAEHRRAFPCVVARPYLL